jgi:glycosyltransferase involved in cell wall biosynthesis
MGSSGLSQVSIVIPARNAAGTLDEQLAAVVAQLEAAGERSEVGVVDNDSDDDTADVVRSWSARVPFVRLVYCGTEGVNAARNAGVEATTSERVLLCDADDIVAEGWVDAMRHALDARGVVGGRLDVTRLNSDFVLRVRNFSGRDRGRLPSLYGYSYVFGSNMGFRRQVYDTIGGFDESMRVGGADEIDFCWRAQAAGFSIARVPDAVVYYRLRHDLAGTLRQSYRYAAGSSTLYRKHVKTGLLQPQTARQRLSMLRKYGHQLVTTGDLRDRAARWRYARRVAWIAGALASAPRTGALV